MATVYMTDPRQKSQTEDLHPALFLGTSPTTEHSPILACQCIQPWPSLVYESYKCARESGVFTHYFSDMPKPAR